MRLIEELAKRKQELENAVRQAQKVLSRKVDGRLDIVKQGEMFRYYKVDSDPVTGQRRKQYIPVDKGDEARKIASRDYAKQVYRLASDEAKVLGRLITALEGKDAYECFDGLHPGRKMIVDPILLSDKEFEKRWLIAQQASYKNTHEFTTQIFTEKNEQVRSKSEKIIADKLNIMGVPYKYEQALTLGEKVYFPDFTLLRKSTRETVYWEHFGLCDQSEYIEKMIEKVGDYSQYHITTGNNLICTFETKNRPLSSKEIERIIQDSLL